MESLLSHAFDYLASATPQKIRKGLRQLEGILAQICLSKTTPLANKRHSMLALGSSPSSPPKGLGDIQHDPAFREFYKLQQAFQWNVAIRMVQCLERLLGKESNGTNDMLVIQSLDLLQGVLLLHPPSRELFAREIHMNVREAILQTIQGLTQTDFPRPPRSFKLSRHPSRDRAHARHIHARSTSKRASLRSL